MKHMSRPVRVNRVAKHLFFTSGVHYWEVFVAAMGKRGTVVIGVAPSENFDGETLNGPLSCWTGGAIGYAANGSVISDGKEVARVEPFSSGDVVGVLLDLNSRTIAFFRNGLNVMTDCDAYASVIQTKLSGDVATTAPSPARLKFTSKEMFAAVSYAPNADDLDIYLAPKPF